MTGHEDPTLDMVVTWPEPSPLHHWWATVMATSDPGQLGRDHRHHTHDLRHGAIR